MASEKEIQRVVDEAAIRRQIHLYSRGIDRSDEAVLRSIYHQGALEHHGGYSGSAAGFCDYALAWVKDVETTGHYITNSVIDIDGDKAFAESSCIAVSFGFADADGNRMNAMIGARYLDNFERRDGLWKIIERHVVFDWNSFVQGTGRWNAPIHNEAIRGARAPRDLLYRFRG